MPNHFTTIGLCGRDYKAIPDDQQEYVYSDSFFESIDGLNLCQLLFPLPDEHAVTWYDWQKDNWGTKWGTYDTKIHLLSGDGSPVLIEFQSAWSPPNAKMMRMIDDYLCKTYFLKNITWIGHDPYDNSTVAIDIEEPSPCLDRP